MKLPALFQIFLISPVFFFSIGSASAQSAQLETIQLEIDEINTDLFGYKFNGTFDNEEGLLIEFNRGDESLVFSASGFDIDRDDEISLILNDVPIGNLATTGNNGIGPTEINLLDSALVAGLNSLQLVHRKPGHKWGVTDLLVADASSSFDGIELQVDVLDEGLYGNKFVGAEEHTDGLEINFSAIEGPLTFELVGFDIDRPTEVAIELNDVMLGHLPETTNNGLIDISIPLPEGQVLEGVNTINLIHEVPGQKWGVKDLVISSGGSTLEVVALNIGEIDDRKFGFNYNGAVEYNEILPITFDWSNQNIVFKLNGFDIDKSDEVAIYLNDEFIGNLALSPNNAEAASEILLPQENLLVGTNRLDLFQKVPGRKWGVNSLSLEEIPAAPPAFIDDYEIVFNDEFNEPTLDTNLWNTGLLWGPYLAINNEEQLYVDTAGINQGFEHDPFSFSNDTLTISATRVEGNVEPPPRPVESDPIWNGFNEYRYNGPTSEGPGYQSENVGYLSGLMTSYDSFELTHGYAEARLKFPKGAGLWPAFWLLNKHYVEDSPEIDIVEFLGQTPETAYHTYHYFNTSNGYQKISTPTFETNGTDWTAGFHTFGVLWSPDSISWFVDGEEVKSISSSEYKISSQSMYVILNLAVGGDWPGSPDADTAFPAEFEIDYVRVYKQKQSEPVDLQNDFDLVFFDEFNGTELDSSKWNTRYLWGPYLPINNEEQYYVDVLGVDSERSYSPFSFESENGIDYMSITARNSEQSGSGLPPSELPDASDPIWTENLEFQQGPYPADNVSYTSGLITSYDAFKFVNGYAEIRARVPEGDGLWPAFWLLNAYYVGPLPEIDIMEILGEDTNTAYHTYHRSDTNGVQISDQYISNPTSSTSFSDGFHTFGVHWAPGKISWYVDGVLSHTFEENVDGENDAYQIMYVIANLAVGGNFNSVVTDAGAIPASLDIDYIRVYQETDPR